MINRVKKISIIILGVLVIILYLIIVDNQFNSEEKPFEIAIITKTKHGNNWESIYKGAYAAANEYGVNIKIFAPDYEKNVDSQINLIEMAIENKVDAIIIAPSDYVKLNNAIDNISSHGIPVIEIVSKTSLENQFYVGTNHYESGEKIGQSLIDLIGDKGNIVVISAIENTNDLIIREEGLRDYIEKNSSIKIIDREYCSSDEFSAMKTIKFMIENYENIDAIIGLNEIISSGIAKTIDTLDKDIDFIGVDSNEETINYLDDNVIDRLIIQNYYSIGYIAVKNIVYILQKKDINSHVYIESNIISSGNLYDDNMQKIVFPLK